MDDFQARATEWHHQCLGTERATDPVERRQRFAEEVIEVLQAAGATRAEVHAIVDWKFDGAKGEIGPEIGSALLTLAALASAHGVGMMKWAEADLASVTARMDEVRERHLAKPRFAVD